MKRILVVSEFSGLNTGFSVMANDILTALKQRGYVVAELASYVDEDDARIHDRGWKVYPVIPSKNNEEERRVYEENKKMAQFGKHRFDETVLDFKPDIVLSWRDLWMTQFIIESPYNHLYYHIYSTCVDSEPPKPEWIDTLSKIDQITSYTDWGLNVTKRHGGKTLNTANINTMPSVDTDTFRPKNKTELRDRYGLKEDINIIGCVYRNQPRKLTPNVMRCFRDFLALCIKNNKEDVAKNTFLYIHTAYPDVGWNIPKEILRYGLSNKVLLTYCCLNCRNIFPSFASDQFAHCYNCGKLSARTTSTAFGPNREQLSDIYNLFDLYIQYSIAGALEIPIIEARSCGVHTIATDYAAPYELNKLYKGADSVDIIGFKQEGSQETEQFRAIPNDSALLEKIYKYFEMGRTKRQNLSSAARHSTLKYHSTEICVNKWIQLIEESSNLDPNRWYKEPNIRELDFKKVPFHLSNNDFIIWLSYNFLPRKHHSSCFMEEKKYLWWLNTGQITKEDLMKKLYKDVIINFNRAEQYRQHKFFPVEKDINYIEF